MYHVNRRAFIGRGLTAFGAGALMSAAGLSQSLADTDYPKSPIRLIVPRSAGGVLDIIARDWVSAPRPISAPSLSKITAAVAA
jgi:hypothetical protein